MSGVIPKLRESERRARREQKAREREDRRLAKRSDLSIGVLDVTEPPRETFVGMAATRRGLQARSRDVG